MDVAALTASATMQLVRHYLNDLPTNPMRVLLFYAGLLYEEFDHTPRTSELPNEIYQGGILYFTQPTRSDRQWYRCDLTPMLLEDVPKELRASVLLLT